MQTGDQGKFTIIFATFILFVALFVLILFLIPKINNIKDLSNQVAQKRAEYEMGLIRVAEAQKASDVIKQAKAESDLLSVALPDAPRAEDAIVSLSKAASDAGLQITSAEVINAQEGVLAVSLSTRGTFENTVSFLDKLKRNLRPTKIVELNFISNDGGEINADYSLEFPYLYKTTPIPSATVSPEGGNSL